MSKPETFMQVEQNLLLYRDTQGQNAGKADAHTQNFPNIKLYVDMGGLLSYNQLT